MVITNTDNMKILKVMIMWFFLEQKNKSIKEYQEVISNINEQLKDNSSEYIMVQKVFLFKKSDFVNAKIIIKDN